jgi:hypothetical protein
MDYPVTGGTENPDVLRHVLTTLADLQHMVDLKPLAFTQKILAPLAHLAVISIKSLGSPLA